MLLHDSPRYGHRPNGRPTAEALRWIVARVAELGLPFLTLTEALDGG